MKNGGRKIGRLSDLYRTNFTFAMIGKLNGLKKGIRDGNELVSITKALARKNLNQTLAEATLLGDRLRTARQIIGNTEDFKTWIGRELPFLHIPSDWPWIDRLSRKPVVESHSDMIRLLGLLWIIDPPSKPANEPEGGEDEGS